MIDINLVRSNLLSKGWDVIDFKLSDSELLNFSSELGKVIPDDNGHIIQLLTPKEKKNGVKNSFSYNYGFAFFPYHVDTAFWAIPARYIVMASEFSSDCNTLLIDLKDLLTLLNASQLSIFYNSVFKLKTFNEIKFVSLLLCEKGELLVRFDPNIMSPFNASSFKAIEIINAFLSKANPISINWTGTNFAIIDNWRLLHARGEYLAEYNRIIKRIYIQKQ